MKTSCMPLRSGTLRGRDANVKKVQGSSLTLQTFPDYLGIFRFDSHYFQGCTKVVEEKVKVLIIQTEMSRWSVGLMNILSCVHCSSEEHGNEHGLP